MLPWSRSGLSAWCALWERAGWGLSKVTDPWSAGLPTAWSSLPDLSQDLRLLALLQLGTLNRMRAPGEDCLTFGSSQSVEQACRIPRGGHCILVLTRLSGFFVPFLWKLSFLGEGTKGLERISVQGHAASLELSRDKMSGFLLLNSCFFPPDILSVPRCRRDLSLLPTSPPAAGVS